MGFSKDFIWGAATASYQIEGAAFEDGKGPSVWDTFSHGITNDNSIIPTMNVRNGDTGDIACDHYHRFKEDVALMKQIGLKAYRFSISWPRILPDGFGKINEKGLQFYSDLVDELLAAGITPYITLFHWDLPQAAYNRGGWMNRAITDWFAEYTKVVVERLSDRVSHWITLNEPQCHILHGHLHGTHAPGDQVSNRNIFIMMHHILLAHGKAVQMIRKYTKQPCFIGYAPNPETAAPATDSLQDLEAARARSFSGTAKELWSNTWWMDPVLLGKYPEDGVEAYSDEFPFEIIEDNDLATMKQPLDFIGLNLYEGIVVKYDEVEGSVIVPKKTGFPKTAMKWIVQPEILYYMPKFVYERYNLPIYITENGLSLPDWVSLDGKVHDPNRIDFLNRYLKELKRAAEVGVDIRGYFTWSLMDNFEWACGYNERFGLIYVDLETQERILKDSSYWYHDVIETNGENL